MASKLQLRATVEFKRLTRRPFAGYLSPFAADARPAIIHCCYHKIGTVWFARVLREVAATYGLSFGMGNDHGDISRFEETGKPEVFVDVGSHVRLDRLGDYVGSHMIRDPRDMVVSGYYYHLWTKEPWANLPMAEYRGMSYKQYLNTLDEEQGLLTEIRRVSFWVPHMVRWNYRNPRMFEIRYEDIRRDEAGVFRAMFQHYGFKEAAIAESCAIARKYTFERLSGGKGSHLRSGRIGEWQERFQPSHKQLFKELYPGAVPGLGYEKDDEW